MCVSPPLPKLYTGRDMDLDLGGGFFGGVWGFVLRLERTREARYFSSPREDHTLFNKTLIPPLSSQIYL